MVLFCVLDDEMKSFVRLQRTFQDEEIVGHCDWQVHISNSIQPVLSPSSNFEYVITNLDGSSLDIGPFVARFGANMNVQSQTIGKGGRSSQYLVTNSVKVKPFTRPFLKYSTVQAERRGGCEFFSSIVSY